METRELIHALPKAELHLHIEGTLEPELKFELAKRNGIKLEHETAQQVKDSYQFTDLTSFLVAYYDGMNVLQTEADFYDLAWAYFEKVATQNLRYVEMFFDPQAHTSRGVPFAYVIKGLRRAQLDADAKLGIRSGLIMCFLRDFQAEYAMATLLESLPYRDWIVGVGLDSDERGNPPAKFAAVYERARTEGYLLTAHCDVDQEQSVENIRQVLQDIGVARIDHGTNVIEEPALVQELLDRGIGLTSCPISNTWVSDGSKVEILKQLLEKGVKICVNSDDPAYFGGYIEENYVRAWQDGDLSQEQLAQLSHNAIDISWAPIPYKVKFRAEIEKVMQGR